MMVKKVVIGSIAGQYTLHKDDVLTHAYLPLWNVGAFCFICLA